MTQRDNKLLDQYLREIGHEITISPEDERELAVIAELLGGMLSETE